jgi:hypothetical protein
LGECLRFGLAIGHDIVYLNSGIRDSVRAATRRAAQDSDSIACFLSPLVFISSRMFYRGAALSSWIERVARTCNPTIECALALTHSCVDEEGNGVGSWIRLASTDASLVAYGVLSLLLLVSRFFFRKALCRAGL